MAVTYAWRLDTNKYAYLVPPVPFIDIIENESEFSDEEWETYGFLSNTPLTDYFMRNVGSTAENTFGQTEDGEDNLEAYGKAFGVMLAKIQKAAEGTYYQQLNGDDDAEKFDWRGMRGVDLLSADVYYNIDAKECADLRGVGIQSIQYLGSIEGSTFVEEGTVSIETGHTLTDMRYKVKGSETTIDYVNENKEITSTTVTVQAGIPGFTDVYGIYLEDQIDENGKSTSTPEHIFIVRNGKHGIQGAKGDKGDKGDKGSIEDEDGNLIDSLETITEKLNDLEETSELFNEFITSLGGVGLSELLSNIQVQISNLQSQINALSEKVNQWGGSEPGGTTTGGTGGGAIEIYKLHQNGEDTLALINDWTDNYGPTNRDEYTFKASGETQLYLLGFLDRKDADGEQGNTYAERLFAIPNIAIESGGITIKGGVRADSISSNYVFADREMYSKQGYYEIDEFDENYYSGVDEVKLYQEAETQTTAE